MGGSWGGKVVFLGEAERASSRQNRTPPFLQGSAGPNPGLFKAWPGHSRPECEERGRNGSAPGNKGELTSVPETKRNGNTRRKTGEKGEVRWALSPNSESQASNLESEIKRFQQGTVCKRKCLRSRQPKEGA